MSGIAGIFYLDGRPVEPETIDGMVGAMKHRGPDGIHTWREGSVALGHCMLQTTPESLHDNLPMESRDGNLVLTADARIDNRDELMRLLELRPDKDRPVTDCDLIMAAYRKWGEKCVDQLLGAFAFAIWDPNTRSLFVARDHVGVNPLFYTVTGSAFVFASEVKGIVSSSNRQFNLDYDRMEAMLDMRLEEKRATAFKEISRLLPGERGVVNREGMHLSRYWELPDGRDGSSTKGHKQLIEELRDVFFASVECRSRTRGTLVAELSGGLDSSAVACALAEVHSEFKTLSYKDSRFKESDESEYIDLVNHRIGVPAITLSYDDLSYFDHLQSSIEAHDEPFSIGNFCLTASVVEKCRKEKISVVLDGYDGDSTVGHGMFEISDRCFDGDWEGAIETIRQVKSVDPTKRGLSFYDAYVAPVIHRRVRQGKLASAWRGARLFAHARGLSNRQAVREIGEDLIHNRHRSPVAPRAYFTANDTPSMIAYQKSLRSPWLYWGMEWRNQYAAWAGFEFRHPFMDKRLIELCCSLPRGTRLRDGYNRWILRTALDPFMPSRVTWRAWKANFHPVLQQLMVEDEQHQLKTHVEQLGTGSYLTRSRYSTARSALARMEERKAEPKDYTGVWTLVYASDWLKSRVT